MGLLLKCEHVGFGYENQDAVLDVNLEVNEGCLLYTSDAADD